MCPLHLLESWYLLALAAAHSKYFFTWKNQDSQKHLEAQSAQDTPWSHAARKRDWMWAQCMRQQQKWGNVHSVAQYVTVVVLRVQPFLKSIPTTSTQAGVQIAITGNALHCCTSSNWRERGWVCDFANSQHNHWTSNEDAPCKQRLGRSWWTLVHLWAWQGTNTSIGMEQERPKHRQGKVENTFLNKERELVDKCCWQKPSIWTADLLTIWFFLC